MNEGSFSTGEVLVGRFRLRRFLARGGMGEVYEALDTELGERVAVKVVRPEYAEDERVMEHFRREVQLARRITHPSVCRIYDISRHPEGEGELTLLSMELLGGETLARRLERDGALDLRMVEAIAGQVIAGVAAAHARGIVHGDLKASNVFLVSEPEGLRAVVTDFGLARVISEAESRRVGGNLVPLTGSLASLAPEVLDGRPVEPASDLYALGVLLFEMVTGRLPFEGSCATSMAAHRLVAESPSPRRWVPELDVAWERATLRCLARRPEDRFADCRALAEALDLPEVPAPTPDLVGPASPRQRPWRRSGKAALWGGLLMVVGLLVMALVWQPGPAGPGMADSDRHPPSEASDGRYTWPPSGTPPGVSNDAYQIYLEGVRLHLDFKEAAAAELFERAVEIDPDFGQAWARLAATYTNLGRPGVREIAARALELGDQLKPTERLYLLGLYHSIHLHEVPRAIEAFEQLLDISPHHGPAHHNLAMAYSRLERYEEALEQQENLVRRGSGSPLAIANLSTFKSLTGRHGEARRLLEGLLEANPDNPWPGLQLGFQSLHLGDLEAAERSFARVSRQHPGILNVAAGRCVLLLLADDPGSALTATGSLRSSVEPAAPLTSLACRQMALAMLGRSVRSIADLEDVEPAIPDEARAWFELWWARWHVARGEYEEALQRAMASEQGGEGQWIGDLGAYLAGQILLSAGDLQAARSRLGALEDRGSRLGVPQTLRLARLLDVELLLAEQRFPEALEGLAELEGSMPERLPIVLKSPNAGWVSLWDLSARVHQAAGNLDEAARHRRLIVSSGIERIQHPFVYVSSLGWLAEHHAARGELEQARVWDRRFLSLWGTGDLLTQERLDRALRRLAESEKAPDLLGGRWTEEPFEGVANAGRVDPRHGVGNPALGIDDESG